MLTVGSFTNTIFNSITYFINKVNTSDLYIVDCGDADKIIEHAKENNLQLKGIFLTHSHFDHINGLNAMLSVFPECIVYTSEYGAAAIYDDKKNFSLFHEHPVAYIGPKPYILKEGDNIDLFEGCTLNIIETPGHCPSSLTYLVGNYIFTGDAYIPGVKVVTNLPKCNKKQAEESVNRILELAKGRIICAGH